MLKIESVFPNAEYAGLKFKEFTSKKNVILNGMKSERSKPKQTNEKIVKRLTYDRTYNDNILDFMRNSRLEMSSQLRNSTFFPKQITGFKHSIDQGGNVSHSNLDDNRNNRTTSFNLYQNIEEVNTDLLKMITCDVFQDKRKQNILCKMLDKKYE